MATISVQWNNEDVTGIAGVSGIRTSKRIKAIGGGWDTSDFSPANDQPNTASGATATVTSNRVYEFKVESVCSEGALTPNLNGVVESISWLCLGIDATPTHNTVLVSTDLTGTDIAKVRFTLRKQSDDSQVAQDIVTSSGGVTTKNFTGLTPAEDYYVQADFAVMLNGVEVYSSTAGQLGSVCSGPLFTTSAVPSGFTEVQGGVGNSVATACAGVVLYYIDDANDEIDTGIQVYVDSGLTTPLTGYTFIRAFNGKIYNISNLTGIVGSVTASTCGGSVVFRNTMNTLNFIDGATPEFYYFPSGPGFPVGTDDSQTGLHGSYTGTIAVNVTLVDSGFLRLFVAGIETDSVAAPVTGTYNLTGSFAAGQNIEVLLEVAS